MFGKIIIKVFTSGFAVNKEVSLFYMISYPVEHHIYYLGTLLFDNIIYNADITLFVYLYGSLRLRMNKII